MANVEPIPRGYHAVLPILVIRGAAKALDFYKKAFGAKINFRQDAPDGKLMHAEIQIGDSRLMLGEECSPHEGHEENCVRSPADLGGTTVNLYLYTKDVDSLFDQCVRAGAKEMMPVEDMFWGDRMGMVKDPFGHVWSIATHVEELSNEEMQARVKEFASHHSQ